MLETEIPAYTKYSTRKEEHRKKERKTRYATIRTRNSAGLMAVATKPLIKLGRYVTATTSAAAAAV